MKMTLPFPVVAIDGPAASGKSTVAREVARRLGFGFVSSGLVYRAAAHAALARAAASFSELQEDLAALHAALGQEGLILTFHGRAIATEDLTSAAVNEAVSRIAAWPEVRAWASTLFHEFAQNGPLVMEGRDIGTAVFPGTPYKIFLDASPEVRSARRRAQGIADPVARRDAEDSSRTVAPLAAAPDAIRVDSSHLTAEQTVEAVLAALKHLGLLQRR